MTILTVLLCPFFQVKPFCQWEKLDMTALERRKLFCSVTFHVVAITCVIWSLYVLIDRTYQEIRDGEPLQWPFWTKLIVVAIGFTGGLVFMYIQCKVYVHLCRKWKAYNRIIVVQVKAGHIFKTLIWLKCTKSSLAAAALEQKEHVVKQSFFMGIMYVQRCTFVSFWAFSMDH